MNWWWMKELLADYMLLKADVDWTTGGREPQHSAEETIFFMLDRLA